MTARVLKKTADGGRLWITGRVFKLTLEGTSPLVLNYLTRDEMTGCTLGVPQSHLRKGTPRAQAAQMLRRDPATGKIALPKSSLFFCLVKAGLRVKNHGQPITRVLGNRQTETRLFEYFRIHEAGIPLRDPDTGKQVKWEPELVAVVDARGLRVGKWCPRISRWKATFSCTLDTGRMSRRTLLTLIRAAGAREGMGSGRAGLGSPLRYGAFRLARVEEITDFKTQAAPNGTRRRRSRAAA